MACRAFSPNLRYITGSRVAIERDSTFSTSSRNEMRYTEPEIRNFVRGCWSKTTVEKDLQTITDGVAKINRWKKILITPILMLSDDEALVRCAESSHRSGKLVRAYGSPITRYPREPSKKCDRASLLAQIRKHFSESSSALSRLHPQGEQRKTRERERFHYHDSIPVSQEQFPEVLRSFLRTLEKG